MSSKHAIEDELSSDEEIDDVEVEGKEIVKKEKKVSKKSKKEEKPIPDSFSEIHDEITENRKKIDILDRRNKKLHAESKKKHNKELKENKRRRRRKSPDNGPRPQEVKPDFAKLFGVTEPITRAIGVRVVNDYIKEHTLQDANEKKFIIPDKKMRRLFKLEDGERKQYNEIPKMISPFFIPNK